MDEKMLGFKYPQLKQTRPADDDTDWVCCFRCKGNFEHAVTHPHTHTPSHTHTHLHRDDVGPCGVGPCHPFGQVHAAVTVGPEERMRVGYCQAPGALPPLGGVLWRLHKGNWSMSEDRKEWGERYFQMSFLASFCFLFFCSASSSIFLSNLNSKMLLWCSTIFLRFCFSLLLPLTCWFKPLFRLWRSNVSF